VHAAAPGARASPRHGEPVQERGQQRKEPLTDAAQVKNALARFDQVEDVSEADRDLAFANIKKAARHYGLNIEEKSWRNLGKPPHTPNPAHD
jgi:ABC-type Na+ efflux pump permease subunit